MVVRWSRRKCTVEKTRKEAQREKSTAQQVVVVGGDAIGGGGMIVAVDYGVAQELARCAGAPSVSHVPQTVNASVRFLASAPTCTRVSERTPRA
jgi:hypothetical protein